MSIFTHELISHCNNVQMNTGAYLGGGPLWLKKNFHTKFNVKRKLIC